MSDFNKFNAALYKQFELLSKGDLFRTDTSKDELWNTYLTSFPEGTNPVYKERTEHDCQCCKQFIRACGNAVAIVNNKKVSIWDISVDGYYQVVADAMSKLVKSQDIVSSFLHYEKNLGTEFNHQLTDNGETIKWGHFHFTLPNSFVKDKDDIGTVNSSINSNNDVFNRALNETSIDAVETVLELIEQNSIYRGEEHKFVVSGFLGHLNKFNKFTSDEEKKNYCWSVSASSGAVSKIRNSAIGTLIVDISESVPLDKAVKMFEAKVAPANYKRPKALITKGMITKAQKKVEQLGIEDSLSRRYAIAEDITINNVLFADRSAKSEMNIFEEMENEVSVDVQKFSKVDEVTINKFVGSILPKAESVEVLFENTHTNNLVSLVAPKIEDSKNILKWHNNFSWAYNGEVADSIKERVKKAGGCVTGVLRCSLSWFNYDDLDIHVKEPNGNLISFTSMGPHRSSGRLDVDMNVSSGGSRSAVENITWTNKSKMQEGTYELLIHQYSKRENVDVGFTAEIEFGGVIHTFNYVKSVSGKVSVAKFEFSKKDGITFNKSLPKSDASKTVWGIPTQKFHKVRMVMNSPNHWDNHATGNKHWFFILENCNNENSARGFFNEFLKEDLNEHRKVFEVLGSKMKTEKSTTQLSGLGFSSTQKSHFFCKVTGAFSRTIKVNF